MQNQTGNSLLKVGKRSERYTHQELRFLLKEVQKYPNIIESPNSHSETKHRKLLLWQYISQKLRDEFPNSSPKSALQLRNWWKRTKSRAKQRLSSVLFTSAKCKYSNDSSREFHENSRGYLEAIFSEICEFKHQILTSYTPEKEDSEFTKFLSETSEEYSEEIMCESSTSSNSGNNQLLQSSTAISCENNVPFNCTSSIALHETNQIQNIDTNDIDKEISIPTSNMFAYDQTKVIPHGHNISEPIIQGDNTSGLLNQIVTNAATQLLSNYKHLIENPLLYNLRKIYHPDSHTLQKSFNERDGDVLIEETNQSGNPSFYFPNVSEDTENALKNETHMFCFPTSSNLSDYSALYKVSKSLRKSNDELNSSLWLELMKIDKEILRLKKRKLDIKITISEGCCNNYFQKFQVP
ncbi:hypothetical protein EWB00_003698 [Schistosoma japonicum]|uniref:Myb/SANT-like DNA-binding domain-containing protein n=1 Tax=Schistosoma japonicum TaxID=6182 RepID=A0A4Z2D7J4_SCHJA|nr:hypothetical protein EWB00_003698 [Schistosoma japonicum]